jgi:hypothetical protein
VKGKKQKNRAQAWILLLVSLELVDEISVIWCVSLISPWRSALVTR